MEIVGNRNLFDNNRKCRCCFLKAMSASAFQQHTNSPKLTNS